MATGDSPAGARRRVRLAVREAREAKGYTQSAVADAMDWSLSKLVRIELGEVTITPNDLRPLLTFLGVTDKDVVDSLIQDSRASRRRKLWWDEPKFRDALTPAIRQLIQFEAEATEYRSYNVLFPAPLQTQAYAEALFRSYGGSELPEDVRRARVETRQRRRAEMLRRNDGIKTYVLLDEIALRRPYVPRDVMVDQLTDVLSLVERSDVMVRILHFDADIPPSLFGAFEILTLPTGDAILYRESGLSDELVEDAAEVTRHREIFDLRWDRALDDDESRAMVERTIKSLSSGNPPAGAAPPGSTGRGTRRRREAE
ncbi:transcriptional regulator [Virgisporangium aliadipatigenens]|uniref:Transcriptional regulator n=1 Tax=Virgisporangium aliadipatigenens TaxID=741659 RepID=A0A8J3YLB3_9ACTN|nr:helix-turn-helix transcriptional regulator [Virgisporangium aliadipatigenens]GIJ47579.1 transcriptional regulator [Virgisporangium aliadipatigenens]